MDKTRILLIGSAGRMGQTIIEVASRDQSLEIVAQCDQGDPIDAAMKKSNVAIDFSHANTIEEVTRLATQHRQPLVIGTTGHSESQRAAIQECARSVPIVFASNFSIGVNALFWLSRKTAELLGPEFAVEIVETHHIHKKDAPSGTAKTLAEIIKRARKSGAEIPTKSIREGEVVGDHTVTFADTTERLELTHHAESREI